MTKLTKLTKEQEAQLVKYRDDVLKERLSYKKIDIEKNNDSINWIYKEYLKKEPPKIIWYCDSPFQANLLFNILPVILDDLDLRANLWTNLETNLRANLWDNLRDNLETNLRTNLRDNLWDNLWTNLWDNLWTNLETNLRANLWANLWTNLRDNLETNLRTNLRDNLQTNLRDNLWTNLQTNLGTNLWDNLRDNLETNLRTNLRDNLQTNLRDNLWTNLQTNLGTNLRTNLWTNLQTNLRANLRANLWTNLETNLRANLRTNLRDNLGENNIFHNIYWSYLDVYWSSYYMFPYKFLGIDYGAKLGKDLERISSFIRNTGFVWFFNDICFVSEKPITVHKENIVLHCELGAAIEFKDGYKLWALNGINVPQWVAETPYEKLDLKKIMEIKNVDIRAQALKRYGAERIIESGYGKIIEDKWEKEKYKLVDLSEMFETYEYAPHLLMENPSIKGLIHCEGVPPEIRSIDQALKWREDRISQEFEKVIHT